MPGSLAPNLDFYEPRTAHGSTLSPGVHAALLARGGRIAEAVEMLRLTARIDLDDIGHMTAGGVHLAAMGSVWRALAFGFAGLSPAGGALAIDPVLPPGWDALELRARFAGSRVRVRIRPDTIELSADPPLHALNPAGEPVELTRDARTFELSAIPREVSVMIVLVAIQADANARPILRAATALADLFDADLAALHVRENDSSSPRELAAAFRVAARSQRLASRTDPSRPPQTPKSLRSCSARAGSREVPNPRATRRSRS